MNTEADRTESRHCQLLMVVAVLAWIPVLGPTPLVADEYAFQHHIDKGVWAHIQHWIDLNGVWRLWSSTQNALLIRTPLFASILAVGFHAGTSALLYLLCRQLRCRREIALLAGAVLAVFPFGYQVMVQIMCLPMLVTVTLFLASFYLCLRFDQARHNLGLLLATFTLSFIAQLNYENLVFAFGLIGPLAYWLRTDGKLLPLRSFFGTVASSFKSFGVYGASLGSLTYLVLFKLLLNSDSKVEPIFNLPSLLSAHYYQYTNYYVFTPWLSGGAREQLFYGWDAIDVVAVLLLSLGALALLLLVKPGADKVKRPATWKPLLVIVLLLFCASAVYVLAGGYSLDTRKKYSLLTLYLLGAAVLFTQVPLVQQHARKLLVALLLIGIPTSWLVTGVYRFEVNRQLALIQAIKDNRQSGPFYDQFEPGTNYLWPQLETTIGFDLYEPWVVAIAIENDRSLADKPELVPDPKAIHFRYEGEGEQPWQPIRP